MLHSEVLFTRYSITEMPVSKSSIYLDMVCGRSGYEVWGEDSDW